MSAMPWDTTENEQPTVAEDSPEGPGEPKVAGTPVVVRRHAGLAALIGAAASAVAIAYLWRASQTASPLDWALCAVMSVVAVVYLAALVDARTPLLVADDLGVRLRLGDEWRGLPWEAIGRVVVHPRTGLVRDGRLVFAPRSLARALDGVDGRARRHVTLNQKMYGAPLAVPLGLATRVSGEGGVAAQVAALAQGRADVVELDPRTLEVLDPADTGPVGTVEGAAPATQADRGDVDSDQVDTGWGEHSRPAHRRIVGGIATIVSRVAKGRERDVDAHPERTATATAGAAPTAPLSPAATLTGPAAPSLLRETRPALRAEATLPTAGSTALRPSPEVDGDDRRPPLPEGRELRRPGSVDLVVEPMVVDDRVRPISTPGDPVAPLVIDDFAVEPAYHPVIGPELTAARTRLGLSVDELAERTRIRPHVIESIEVDDFAPCGGDFYARGHLRTLARVLGKDAAPLLATFEERYASAPINARKVFEAELATGMTGSMRSTVGGPSWSLLVGVVLALVLVWGVVRLFTTEPVGIVEVPAAVLNGSAGVDNGHPVAPGSGPASVAEPVQVRLSASQSDTRVVVRDGDGTVVFTGELVLGERRSLQVEPPVRVLAADGGAVEIRVAGVDRGFLGEPGEPARRSFASLQRRPVQR